MKTKEWELFSFSKLIGIIKREADNAGPDAPGHDLIHDLTVARYCHLIGGHDEIFTRMATIAAFCHSTDRRYPTYNDTELAEKIGNYLRRGTSLNDSEINFIILTVLSHHKPNEEDDNNALRILKDADRLACLGLQAIIRCGQFYHNLPTFDPRYVLQQDPSATYRNPLTVLHDVRSALQWDPREGHTEFCLRLPKAIELATPYFDWLKAGIALAERQVVETRIREFINRDPAAK